MHRARGFAATAALLAISLTGCEELEGVFGTIGGQVSIEGKGIDGVTVTLSDGTTTITGGGGAFIFVNVPADIYTVLISGYPADAVFERTADVVTILADGVTRNVNFNGTYLRTSGIWGRVTAGGRGLGGIEVRLTGPSSSAAITTPNGEYALSNLRAGEYTVEISNFPASDVVFSSTTKAVTVLPHEARVVSFEGEYLRSAAITGRVTVAGAGLPGVTVNLSGPESAAAATTTDAGGNYTFAELRSGEYHLDISGWDAERYAFEVTSTTVTLAGGETANVPFDGVNLRAGGIRGHVRVDGAGLDGVTVVLSGAADDTATTADAGRYAFAELTAGDYRVAISGFDTAAYNFASTASPTIALERGESLIVNFEGSSSQSATIAGYLYVDENPKNDRFESGDEDLLPHQGFPVVLQGPGLADTRPGTTDATGRYAFTGLGAGSYRVVPDLTPAAVAALDAEGYAYGGAPTGVAVTVAGGGSAEAHLPVDITHQTITVRAVLGAGDRTGPAVEGVEVDLYATGADADAGTGPLASAVTDSTGTASFTFPRAAESDRIVHTRVGTLPGENFAVTANSSMQLTYPPRHRTTAAPETVKLVNRRADLRFSARTVGTARGGGGPLAEWDAEVVAGDPGSGSGIGSGSTGTGAVVVPAGIEPTDSLGELAFHVLPEAADLPVRYTVRLAGEQAGAMGELFEQTPLPGEDADSGAVTLTYTHDGLSLPGDTLDLGEIEVRFTTQTLVVGVHWERDHKAGYTTEGIYGDERPSGSREAIDITLLVGEGPGHLFPWRSDDPDHDINVGGNPRHPGENGLVVFRNLPADVEFTVDADIGAHRELVSSGLVQSWQNLGAYDVGAFGSGSGGGPRVRLCPQSTAHGLPACSTFSYLWTNGVVWGWVGSADYGGDPTPNDAIADRFGVSAPDVFANGLDVSLAYDGSLVTYDASTVVGAQTEDGEFVVGDGEFRFSGVPTGRYTLSVTGDDEWGPATEQSFLLSQAGDDGSGALKAFAVTLPYLKTSVSGTAANDADGDGQASPQETASGIEMELLRVEGIDTVATGLSDTTTVLGAFSFTDIVEGPYVVKASSDDYFVAGTNTVPVDHSPVLVTDARPGRRAITSGDALPVWDYATSLIDADAGQGGVQSGAADFSDADFVVLRSSGYMSGRVTRPDDGTATDPDADPDPFAGLTVHVDHCLATAGVRCQPGRFGARVRATTRRDGSWEARGLPEGYHLVTVSFPGDLWQYGALPGTDEPRRSYFERLQGEEPARDSLDFHLVPRGAVAAAGVLFGRVTRPDDGGTTDGNSDPDPFAGLSVHMDHCEVPADESSCQTGQYRTRVSVETADDGTWTVDELEEGYHLVTVDLPDAEWDYGAPPGNTQPVSRYFVEVDAPSSGSAAGVGAAGATALASAEEGDTLDFHLVQRLTSTQPMFGVLVLFYNSTRGPTWDVQTNWLTDRPYGEWHGVVTDNAGNVVELVLPTNGLAGRPTPLLDSLVHLRRLDLTSNFLDGYPSSFGNFDSLTYLDLSNTWMSGDIPGWIADLTSLDTLKLDFNRLTGTIPTGFGDLADLSYLDLSENRLTGSIPVELGNLTDLERLYLHRNRLTGSIPDTLGALSDLKVLDLSENSLSGAIPTALGNLSGLQALRLQDNDLSGAIPTELTGLENLEWLDLGDNGLTGTIPSFADRTLDWLRLANNNLTGAIPEGLGDMQSLHALDLRGNGLTGAIPAKLGQLARLQILHLDDNALTGNIPTEFGDLTALSDLYVNGNSGMSGTLPTALTGLTKLRYFFAQGTSLCAPTDSAFQTWLGGVRNRNVTNCSP